MDRKTRKVNISKTDLARIGASGPGNPTVARSRFRWHIDLGSNASPDLISAHFNAIADVLALGLLLAPGHVKVIFPHDAGVNVATFGGRPERPFAHLTFPELHLKVQPAYGAVSVVRSEILNTGFVHFQNPLSGAFSANVATEAGKTAVSIFEKLALTGPARKKALAEADQATIQAILDDATIELSIDERVALIERAEIDNKLKQVELDRNRVQLASEMADLVEKLMSLDLKVLALPKDLQERRRQEVAAIVDNVRVLASVSLLRESDVSITVKPEGPAK